MSEPCRFGYEEHDGARYCFEHGGFLEPGPFHSGSRRCDRAAVDAPFHPEAPAQAHPLGPDGFTPLVSDGDYRAAFYRVMERCEELKTSVAEHQWNALEMARKADQAERRAEEAEFHVEQLRDARDRAERQAEDAEAAIEATRDLLDGWEQDGPEDPAVRLLIQRGREMLALGERFREARDGTEHE